MAATGFIFRAVHKSGLFYGWVIAGAGLLLGLVGIGARYSYGVFLQSIETDFGLTRTASSGIFSLYMLLSCLIAVAGGWGLDRYGPRRVALIMATFTGLSLVLTSQAGEPFHLLITYSIFLSLGTGAIYGTVNSTTSRWFNKRRGLAVGIASSGGGFGAIVIAPLAALLISQFGWRTAFILLGVISWAVMGAASLLLIRDPQEVGRFPDGRESDPLPQEHRGDHIRSGSADFTLGQAIRKSGFWLLSLAWLFLSLSLHMMFIHVVPFAVDKGVSPMKAAFVLSMIGIANSPGRLVMGRLSDRFGAGTLGIICLLLQGGTMAWLTLAGPLWMLYTSAFVFGFLWGGSGTLTTVLTVDIFGTRSLGVIMGVMSGWWAVGAAAGPAVGGYLFDLNGRYSTAFAVGIAALAAASLLIALIRPSRKPPS